MNEYEALVDICWKCRYHSNCENICKSKKVLRDCIDQKNALEGSVTALGKALHITFNKEKKSGND